MTAAYKWPIDNNTNVQIQKLKCLVHFVLGLVCASSTNWAMTHSRKSGHRTQVLKHKWLPKSTAFFYLTVSVPGIRRQSNQIFKLQLSVATKNESRARPISTNERDKSYLKMVKKEREKKNRKKNKSHSNYCHFSLSCVSLCCRMTREARKEIANVLRFVSPRDEKKKNNKSRNGY